VEPTGASLIARSASAAAQRQNGLASSPPKIAAGDETTEDHAEWVALDEQKQNQPSDLDSDSEEGKQEAAAQEAAEQAEAAAEPLPSPSPARTLPVASPSPSPVPSPTANVTTEDDGVVDAQEDTDAPEEAATPRRGSWSQRPDGPNRGRGKRNAQLIPVPSPSGTAAGLAESILGISEDAVLSGKASCVSIMPAVSNEWCISNCKVFNCPSSVCKCEATEAKAEADAKPAEVQGDSTTGTPSS
jgi:hypothetical protein